MVRESGKPVLAGWVTGTPRGGGSRARFVNGRAVSFAAAGRSAVLWRGLLTRHVREVVELAGGRPAVDQLIAGAPLGLAVRFVFGTRYERRWDRFHTSRPDVDNLLKIFLDVLTKEGALGSHDDARIAACEPVKVWGRVAGAGWTLRALAPPRSGRTLGVDVLSAPTGPEWVDVAR